jgi:hypothetical protein
MTGHQVLHRGGGNTIRDQDKLRPGFLLKQRGQQTSADCDDRHRRLIGIARPRGRQKIASAVVRLWVPGRWAGRYRSRHVEGRGARFSTVASGAIRRKTLDAATMASGASIKLGEPGEALDADDLPRRCAGDVPCPSTCPAAAQDRCRWCDRPPLDAGDCRRNVGAKGTTCHGKMRHLLSDCIGGMLWESS